MVKRDSVWLKQDKIAMPQNTFKCVHFLYKRAEHVGFRES